MLLNKGIGGADGGTNLVFPLLNFSAYANLVALPEKISYKLPDGMAIYRHDAGLGACLRLNYDQSEENLTCLRVLAMMIHVQVLARSDLLKRELLTLQIDLSDVGSIARGLLVDESDDQASGYLCNQCAN